MNYRKHVWIGLMILILAGCHAPVRSDVDGIVCASASRPVDLAAELPDKDSPPTTATKTQAAPMSLPPFLDNSSNSEKLASEAVDNLVFTSAQQPAPGGDQPKKLTTLETRLQVPPGVPGASVAP